MTKRKRHPPARRLVPREMSPLLGSRPLISGENADAYDELFSKIAVAIEPTDAIEWMFVKDVADITWDIQRLRKYKSSIISLERKEALGEILGIVLDEGHLTTQERERAGAKLAAAYFSGDRKTIWDVYSERGLRGIDKITVIPHFKGNLDALEAFMKLHGIIGDAISSAAFDRKPASLETIDRLLMAAEGRRSRALREIDRRRTTISEIKDARRTLDDQQEAEPNARAKRKA